MKDEQSERPPLSERVFNYWFVTLPWIVFIVALDVLVGRPFAKMLVVLWVKGTDAYFQQGVRLPKSKVPMHFTDGTVVPQLPYGLANIAVFLVIAGGVSFSLIYVLRFYERRSKNRDNDVA